MSVRSIRIRGAVTETPMFLHAAASGTIRRGAVVEISRANQRVQSASSSTTTTAIFGVALDYVEGASDTRTRVVPFSQGKLWEIDCANAVSTAQLFIKHALTDSLTLANTSYDQTTSVGVFMAYNLAGGTMGIQALQGEFLRSPVVDTSEDYF